MLAKEHKEFIDLKEKPEMMGTIGPSEMKGEKPKPRGPVVYVRDVKLPLTIEDLNTSLTAKVKITPREIRVSNTNGEEKISYDLEITGIKFES